MKSLRNTFHVFLILTVLSWHLPIRAMAQTSPSAGPQQTLTEEIQPIEIVLHRGTLSGIVMDSNGKPAAGRTVVLGRNGKVLAKVRAGNNGRFQFNKMKAGDFQIATNDSAAFLRCVNAGAASKDAVKQVLLSRQAMIERGQQPASVLLNPLLIGLVIAAAIVIPIVVSNNKDDAS